jgi:hypothetical protein
MTYNFILFLSLLTGKTLLAKTLARFVNVPFVIADATTLTQASAEPCVTSNFTFILHYLKVLLFFCYYLIIKKFYFIFLGLSS